MKELTHQEEIYILQYLIEHQDLFKDAGCARMVFSCDDDLASKLGIYDATNKYVIKIAMGAGGIEQLKAEVSLWLEYGDDGYLARVVAAGRFIEIMEYVDCWDFTDEADCGFDDCDYEDLKDLILENNPDTLEEYDASCIADTILFLQRQFGETSDNGQLGKTLHGYWVAYDYGFDRGKGRDSQTSDLSDYIYRDEVRERYLRGLIVLLNQEDEFMDEWEKELLNQIQREDSGEDEEEEENETEYYGDWPDTQDIERDLEVDEDDTQD